MTANKYEINASIYAKHGLSSTHYLAFKNVPEFINKYTKGLKTLDYGCGSGRSTRFLKELKLDVEGVDINESMLKEAMALDDAILYRHIKSAVLPYHDQTFDIVFSSLVLFEIATKQEILDVFNEIYRVLKNDGIFIAVTGSQEMYSHPWLSLDINFPENKKLKSGAVAKILLKDINLELYDYFWTNDDYQEIIEASNFNLIEMNYPLGDDNDGYSWVSENVISPYVSYILNKK